MLDVGTDLKMENTKDMPKQRQETELAPVKKVETYFWICQLFYLLLKLMKTFYQQVVETVKQNSAPAEDHYGYAVANALFNFYSCL